jgi:hypothetical protein
MELKENMQLWVNEKWYMDVLKIENDKVTVQIKYTEPGAKLNYYKQITIPNIFKNLTQHSYIVKCKVNEKELKKHIGSLINRLTVEKDIVKMFENAVAANGANTAGMGAVSMPGLSGVAGVPGAAGSGDISTTKLPASMIPTNSFGLEIDNSTNKRARKKLKKNKTKGKKLKPIVKTPVVILTNESVDDTETDAKYKSRVFAFLDYPVSNDIDIDLINSINKERQLFVKISADRIKKYFKDFYNINKTLITIDASDWFENNILTLF